MRVRKRYKEHLAALRLSLASLKYETEINGCWPKHINCCASNVICFAKLISESGDVKKWMIIQKAEN